MRCGLVHGTMIYDNSSIYGPVLLLRIANDLIEVNKLDQHRPLHQRIAAIVGEALGASQDAMLKRSQA